MSRFHLSIYIILIGFGVSAQNPAKQLLKAGDEAMELGDYNAASNFYEQAMVSDSSVEILWKCAQAYRAYRHYEKAAELFGVVYDKEGGLIYQESLLLHGQMLKQSGDIEGANEVFKQAKKKYKGEKNETLADIAKEEYSNIGWIEEQQIDDSVIPMSTFDQANSKNAEFGHSVFGNFLYFSSLRADSIAANDEVYDTNYVVELYQLNLDNQQVNKVKELNQTEINSGNGSFSLDGKRFYFSRCNSSGQGSFCSIFVAKYTEGKFTDIDSLGEIINYPGESQTMPRIVEFKGQERLYFVANSSKGKGGYDIYWSDIRNGNVYTPPQSFEWNSVHNELSPFWDFTYQRLYFSSTRFPNFGGYDIFYAELQEDGSFSEPINAGRPINSPANDLYYFQQDSLLILSSNREGSLYSNNPTCCTDIFAFYKPIPEPPEPIDTTPEVTPLEELMARLPIALYFHNDEPNPRSWDTTTSIDYLSSYRAYREMENKYRQEYSSGLSGSDADSAKQDISNFFADYVDFGVKQLDTFCITLLEELQKGREIELTIKGFASPLAKSDYNVNLTKRRIASLVNYLKLRDSGAFIPYLEDSLSTPKLTFAYIPFGEYQSDSLVSDNLNDQKNSVYSRAAALERKIEIQSVQFKMPEAVIVPPVPAKTVQEMGIIPPNKIQRIEFALTNESSNTIEIEEIRVPCHCSEAEILSNKLAPGETTLVTFIFNPKGYEGQEFVKSIYVKTKGVDEELRLILHGQVGK